MTERTNGHGMYPWGRLVLFVLFLIFLAIVLKAMRGGVSAASVMLVSTLLLK